VLRHFIGVALALGTELLAGGITGCGDSTGPDFDNDQFVGTWSVQVQASTGCWPAFELRFRVDQDDADASNPEDDLINVTSVWWGPDQPTATDDFRGSFDWGRSQFELRFHLGAGEWHLSGSDPNPTSVTGTFSDPDGAVFSPRCTGTATASRLET
jgi:hypothetical protein